MKLLVMLFAFAGLGLAQDYWMATGAGFNQYADKQVSGWVSFGVKMADKTYSYTTVETTAAGSSTRTGVAQLMVQRAGLKVMALGDAGSVTKDGALGAAYSGGGVIAYDLSKVFKISGLHAVFTVRALNGSVIGLQPAFAFGFGKAF